MVKVWFDMDGVLANFDDAYFGKNFVFDENRPFDDSRFELFVAEKKFETLEVIETGQLLLNTLIQYQCTYQIGILGSVASSKIGRPFGLEVANQKKLWLKTHFADIYEKLDVVFVEHKGKKQNFATPNSVLIDDCNKNVIEFAEAGGQSILFNSSMSYQDVVGLVVKAIDNIDLKNQLF